MSGMLDLDPIVAQLLPSEEQVPAILARGQDIAVTAGAGTGKTRTLVARYLALLAEGVPLRAILAITFTRKAAREMRNRVREEMRRYLGCPEIAPATRAAWQRRYTELDAARIGTFHGLCGDILRAFPAEANIDPRFQMLDEGQAAILLNDTLETALAWAADDPSTFELFATLGERGLRHTLQALLEQRLDTEAAFAALPPDILGHWDAELARQPSMASGRKRTREPEGLNELDRALARLVPALASTFHCALAQYTAAKAQRDSLDFDDLEARALALLQQHGGARQRWQNEFQAILVDEFQDTNARQRDLVTLLNGAAGKLFIVGDAKQSIYAFRGADVRVFRGERARIEAVGGLACALATSYRAHRGLIEGLNELLAPVLGQEPAPDRPWLEPFAPLAWHRVEPRDGYLAPHIELHLTVGTKGSGGLRRAADVLAARLAGLARNGAGFGDMAILCRTSASFAPYEDALEAAGIPYVTVAGRGFYGRPEIRDLLNALQAIGDPTDDLALAGLLRSPVWGLTDGSLYLLISGRRELYPACDLWATLPQLIGRLPPGDAARAERAHQLIADLHAQAGRTAVADLLKGFLDATGYRAALVRAGQRRSARNVSKLLSDAQASGLIGVGEFLEYLANLRDTGTREGEARVDAEGSVQIMSVHAAKGLEFPVVVIGDANSSRPGQPDVLVDETLGVLLPLGDQKSRPAIYGLARELDRDRQSAESLRLFYVAATRAREKLILSGCLRLKGDGTPGWLNDWFSGLAQPQCLGLGKAVIQHDDSGSRVLQIPLATCSQRPVGCYVYEPAYVCPREKRAPAPWARDSSAAARMPPRLLAPVLPIPQSVDRRVLEQDRIPAQRVWRVVPAVENPSAPSWVIGSLVHGVLAIWRFPGSRPAEAVAWEAWIAAQARGYGLIDRTRVQDAVRRVARIATRFQASLLYAEMARAERRLHEVPYSLERTDGTVESGVIDALFLRNGAWQLVEFKTDRIADETALQDLLSQEDYVPQVRRYAAAVERLLGQRPRLLLCLLNYRDGVRVEPV